jgi:hypothetical protein
MPSPKRKSRGSTKMEEEEPVEVAEANPRVFRPSVHSDKYLDWIMDPSFLPEKAQEEEEDEAEEDEEGKRKKKKKKAAPAEGDSIFDLKRFPDDFSGAASFDLNTVSKNDAQQWESLTEEKKKLVVADVIRAIALCAHTGQATFPKSLVSTIVQQRLGSVKIGIT